MYLHDRESKVIRMYEGKASLMVPWEKIASISDFARTSVGTVKHLYANLELKDGTRKHMRLSTFSHIGGKSDDGHYTISAEKLGSVVPKSPQSEDQQKLGASG
jgi:hypothetical protein